MRSRFDIAHNDDRGPDHTNKGGRGIGVQQQNASGHLRSLHAMAWMRMHGANARHSVRLYFGGCSAAPTPPITAAANLINTNHGGGVQPLKHFLCSGRHDSPAHASAS
jgi:hypothetical protein